MRITAPPPLAAIAAAHPVSTSPAAKKKHARAADEKIADQGDDADENRRNDQKLDVAVADMGQFVGEHRLELGVVKSVGKSARHGDRVVLFANAAGEGIAGVGVDDAQRRHGYAAADAEIFEKIPEPRIVGPFNAAPAGDGIDDQLMREKAIRNHSAAPPSAIGTSVGRSLRALAKPVATSGLSSAEMISAKAKQIRSNRKGKPASRSSDLSRLFQI
jgi:hypothetical protein